MSFEETLAVLLEAKLAPFRADVGRLTAEVEAIRRAMPPALVSQAQAARTLGVSLSTVRRRVRDGSLPSKRLGSKVLVDLAALHPADQAEVIRLAHTIKPG